MPVGICERRKANLYVASHVKDCAVFLGALNSDGEFVPHGTGFFVGMVASEYGIFYLTTAKHVIDQINGDVIARINIKGGRLRLRPSPEIAGTSTLNTRRAAEGQSILTWLPAT